MKPGRRLNAVQAAELAGVPVSQFRAAIRRGELPVQRGFGNARLRSIDEADVVAWRSMREVESLDDPRLVGSTRRFP